MYKFAGFLPSPLVQVCPRITILRPFVERVMALRSLPFSACGAGFCAQEVRSAIKRNARNDPELAKVSGEVQEFCVCKGSK